jgi:hypothetical protein
VKKERKQYFIPLTLKGLNLKKEFPPGLLIYKVACENTIFKKEIPLFLE